MAYSVQSNTVCTGCSNCYHSCPKRAITMTRNDKGFLHPLVNNDLCINCGTCIKVCHVVNDDNLFCEPIHIFAAKNRSEIDRSISSSGGLFILLARLTLENDGVVYGAAFDENNHVKHIRAVTMEEVKRCCQSKYVQSDAVDAYRSIIEDIRADRMILFVGTPCQVSALQYLLRFYRLKNENVLFVDFICHGTPSPIVFNDYLSMIEKKYRGKIQQFYFRDKSQGWRGNGYKVIFTDRKHVINGFYLRGYNKLFPLSTNEACFQCKYSKPEHVSDITLGDFWGIEDTPISDFDDNLGVSMILVNTQKGERWVKKLQEQCEFRDAILDYCKKNTPLFDSPKKGSLYDKFWECYTKQGWEYTFDKYCKFKGKNGFFERLKWVVMYKLNLKNVVFRMYKKNKNE